MYLRLTYVLFQVIFLSGVAFGEPLCRTILGVDEVTSENAKQALLEWFVDVRKFNSSRTIPQYHPEKENEIIAKKALRLIYEHYGEAWFEHLPEPAQTFWRNRNLKPALLFLVSSDAVQIKLISEWVVARYTAKDPEVYPKRPYRDDYSLLIANHLTALQSKHSADWVREFPREVLLIWVERKIISPAKLPEVPANARETERVQKIQSWILALKEKTGTVRLPIKNVSDPIEAQLAIWLNDLKDDHRNRWWELLSFETIKLLRADKVKLEIEERNDEAARIAKLENWVKKAKNDRSGRAIPKQKSSDPDERYASHIITKLKSQYGDKWIEKISKEVRKIWEKDPDYSRIHRIKSEEIWIAEIEAWTLKTVKDGTERPYPYATSTDPYERQLAYQLSQIRDRYGDQWMTKFSAQVQSTWRAYYIRQNTTMEPVIPKNIFPGPEKKNLDERIQAVNIWVQTALDNGKYPFPLTTSLDPVEKQAARYIKGLKDIDKWWTLFSLETQAVWKSYGILDKKIEQYRICIERNHLRPLEKAGFTQDVYQDFIDWVTDTAHAEPKRVPIPEWHANSEVEKKFFENLKALRLLVGNGWPEYFPLQVRQFWKPTQAVDAFNFSVASPSEKIVMINGWAMAHYADPDPLPMENQQNLFERRMAKYINSLKQSRPDDWWTPFSQRTQDIWTMRDLAKPPQRLRSPEESIKLVIEWADQTYKVTGKWRMPNKDHKTDAEQRRLGDFIKILKKKNPDTWQSLFPTDLIQNWREAGYAL